MTHRERTNWLRKVDNELEKLTVKDDMLIKIKKVRKQERKMSSWKSLGPHGVQGYWIKDLSNLHTSSTSIG